MLRYAHAAAEQDSRNRHPIKLPMSTSLAVAKCDLPAVRCQEKPGSAQSQILIDPPHSIRKQGQRWHIAGESTLGRGPGMLPIMLVIVNLSVHVTVTAFLCPSQFSESNPGYLFASWRSDLRMDFQAECFQRSTSRMTRVTLGFKVFRFTLTW